MYGLIGMVAMALGVAAAEDSVYRFASLAIVAFGLILLFDGHVLVLVLLLGSLTVDLGRLSPSLEFFVQVQKATVLGYFLAAALRGRFRLNMATAPLVALGLLLGSTLFYATPLEGVTGAQRAQSLITLSAGWLVISVARYSESERLRLLAVLAWLAPVSVMLGVVLWPVEGAPFASDAGSGLRLQGASYAAYLGAYATYGIGAYICARADGLQRGAGRTSLMIVNAAILLMTLGRGPLIACGILAAPSVRLVWRAGRWRPSLWLISRYSLIFGGILGLFVYLPVVLNRTQGESTADSSSGRTEAWNYFISVADVNRLFGRGIGAGPIAGQYGPPLIKTNFTGQHNEYVRFFLESGWIGSIIFWFALLVAAIMLVSTVPRRYRPHVAALFVAFLVFSLTDNTISSLELFLTFSVLVSCYPTGGAAETRSHVSGSAAVPRPWDFSTTTDVGPRGYLGTRGAQTPS